MYFRDPCLLEARLTTIAQPTDELTGQCALNKNGFAAISGDSLTGMVQRLNRSNWHMF
jgi:hypothetical protein